MLNGCEKFAAKSVPKLVKSSRKPYEMALTVIMGHHGRVLLHVVGHRRESINNGWPQRHLAATSMDALTLFRWQC